MLRTSLLALALVMGAGQAFAATPADAGFDTEDTMECTFVADLGGYQCVLPVQHATLTEPVDGGAKKKLTIKQVNPNVNLPQFP